MAKRKRSELEGCVLALLWAKGPSTPYAIRQVFLDSPNPQWSGSSGSIYPLLDRLQREKLVRSKVHATGKRPGRLFSLTAAGSAAFRAWLGPPVEEWVAGVPPDPLRTRVHFLGALSTRRRATFLREARQSADEHLRLIEEDCRRRAREGSYEYLMARGAVMMMQARCAWLREVAESLD
jgi:DNA-binding PadR family transcriptional regulator